MAPPRSEAPGVPGGRENPWFTELVTHTKPRCRLLLILGFLCLLSHYLLKKTWKSELQIFTFRSFIMVLLSQ